MNLKLFLILVVQGLLATTVFSRTITVDGLTFGSKDGNLTLVGVSTRKELLPAEKPGIVSKIRDCEKAGLHPFKWQEKVPEGVSLLFPVSGQLAKIHENLKDFCSGNKRHPSWIWAGINEEKPLSLSIHMYANGEGWIDIFQDGKKVGYTPCMSSPRSKQMKTGLWSIASKGNETQNGEKGRMSVKWGCWMSWALEIENSVGGCYLHGGSLISESDGCVHLPRPVAKVLYHLLRKGDAVEIFHEKGEKPL